MVPPTTRGAARKTKNTRGRPPARFPENHRQQRARPEAQAPSPARPNGTDRLSQSIQSHPPPRQSQSQRKCRAIVLAERIRAPAARIARNLQSPGTSGVCPAPSGRKAACVPSLAGHSGRTSSVPPTRGGAAGVCGRKPPADTPTPLGPRTLAAPRNAAYAPARTVPADNHTIYVRLRATTASSPIATV